MLPLFELPFLQLTSHLIFLMSNCCSYIFVFALFVILFCLQIKSVSFQNVDSDLRFLMFKICSNFVRLQNVIYQK